jgi:hypothetical protein
MAFLGKIASKGGAWLGRAVNKAGNLLNSFGSMSSKVLQGVNTISSYSADLLAIGGSFFPPLEPLGEIATLVADTSKMGLDFLGGGSLTEVLKTNIPKLLTDEVKGAIPGLSAISGASDLASRLSNDLFGSDSLLKKRSKGLTNIFDLQLN